MTVDAIGTQAWVAGTVGGPPCPELIRPVLQAPRAEHKPHEPGGRQAGFWTSTYQESCGSAWIQWMLAERFHADPANPMFHLWALEPDPSARLYVIDSYEDLEQLVARYPHPQRDEWWSYPEWEAVGRDFDGVQLTESGVWPTRLSLPLNLYSWDCESTLWFRWAFTGVRDLGERRVELEYADA